ncbi:MAG: restriction endonuclease, partial [Acidobacteriota bacterium]
VEPKKLRRVFWLSARGQRRESDATLLYEPGKGVRIDIGFIGRGNPEISLDKVSRFEREISLHGSKWYMATLIIVDRIGARSRIPRLAKEVGGTIVQMSMAYWPQEVARVFRDVLGYEHKLAQMRQSEVGPYLRAELSEVPLEKLSRLVAE